MNKQKTQAIILMLTSSLAFSIMQVFVKISAAQVGTLEQTFFRNLISLLIVMLISRHRKINTMQEIKNSGWSIWGRSFFGFIGIILLFYATGNARQADVALLNRTSPIFVTIFAGLFLKERRTQRCLEEG